MPGITGLNSLGNANPFGQLDQIASLSERDAANLKNHGTGSAAETEAVFQEFVAGTFYSSMLKAMHAMHDKPAYMHGGQAEEMFQNQLDQQVSKELAREHGSTFVDSLLPAFSREINQAIPQSAGPSLLNRV